MLIGLRYLEVELAHELAQGQEYVCMYICQNRLFHQRPECEQVSGFSYNSSYLVLPFNSSVLQQLVTTQADGNLGSTLIGF